MTEYLKHPMLIAKKVKMQSIQCDIFGETVLTYLEKYDAYTMMETSIINEVMEDIVYGEAEMQAPFLQDCTLYHVAI